MKVPFNEDETLAYIEGVEKVESSVSTFLGYRSKIYSIEKMAIAYKKPIDSTKNEVIFSTKSYQLFTGTLGGLFILGLTAGLLNSGNDNNTKILFFCFTILFAIILIHDLTNKKDNFKIEVSYDKLRIKDTEYTWSEINKIYYLDRPNTKRRRNFIVLALCNGVCDKVNVTNILGFTGSENKFAAYVEYFRKKETA